MAPGYWRFRRAEVRNQVNIMRNSEVELHPTLSASLIEVIRRRRGLTTNREVAELLGLSESYISRVASEKLNFTLEHLAEIEALLQVPLPQLLLDAVRDANSAVHPDLRPAYDLLIESLAQAADAENREIAAPVSSTKTGRKETA